MMKEELAAEAEILAEQASPKHLSRPPERLPHLRLASPAHLLSTSRVTACSSAAPSAYGRRRTARTRSRWRETAPTTRSGSARSRRGSRRSAPSRPARSRPAARAPHLHASPHSPTLPTPPHTSPPLHTPPRPPHPPTTPLGAGRGLLLAPRDHSRPPAAEVCHRRAPPPLPLGAQGCAHRRSREVRQRRQCGGAPRQPNHPRVPSLHRSRDGCRSQAGAMLDGSLDVQRHHRRPHPPLILYPPRSRPSRAPRHRCHPPPAHPPLRARAERRCVDGAASRRGRGATARVRRASSSAKPRAAEPSSRGQGGAYTKAQGKQPVGVSKNEQVCAPHAHLCPRACSRLVSQYPAGAGPHRPSGVGPRAFRGPPLPRVPRPPREPLCEPLGPDRPAPCSSRPCVGRASRRRRLRR